MAYKIEGSEFPDPQPLLYHFCHLFTRIAGLTMKSQVLPLIYIYIAGCRNIIFQSTFITCYKTKYYPSYTLTQSVILLGCVTLAHVFSTGSVQYLHLSIGLCKYLIILSYDSDSSYRSTVSPAGIDSS